MISYIRIIINRIKNKLLVAFRRELHSYNTIENVFQWLADYCVVLSLNFNDVINKSKVTLKRKLIYYTNFAIQLSVLIKYAFLGIYGDPHTIALLGESFHYLTNIYFASHLFVWIQLTMVPILIYMRYIGDKRVAKIFVTISRFDSNRALNRINNRKLTKKVWLMNKMFAIIMMATKWLICPLVSLYCAISVHLEQPTRYNIVTLAINSFVQLASVVNTLGIITIYSIILEYHNYLFHF